MNSRPSMKHFLGAAMAACAVIAIAISSATAADKLKLTLNWTPGGPSVGIDYAYVLGYYEDAGIDLEIEYGKGSGTTSQLVAAGSTDVGLASAPSALAIAAKGAPIKIITALRQLPDWGIISLKDTPITSPKDLEGMTIAIPPGSADIALFDTMLTVNGVDKSMINIIYADAASYIGLLAEKKVDGVSAAPGDVMIPLDQKGVETKILFYKDNGAPLVGMSLIARDDKLQANPDLYKRFVEATLKGFEATLKDPEAAVDALRSRYPDAQGKEELLQELTKYGFALYCAPGAVGLGKPPADVWVATGEILTATFGSLGDGGIESKHTEDYLPAQLPACP